MKLQLVSYFNDVIYDPSYGTKVTDEDREKLKNAYADLAFAGYSDILVFDEDANSSQVRKNNGSYEDNIIFLEYEDETNTHEDW